MMDQNGDQFSHQDSIRENGVEDMMVETRRRVKLFVLNEAHDWEDKGTGHVTVVFQEYLHGLALVVRSEDNGAVLLESRIESDRVYQKQDATLIVWDENEIEKALSFQERQGCDDVWSKIREVQGRNELGEISDNLTHMEGFEDDQIFQNSQEIYAIEMPVVNTENLPNIYELLTKYTNPVVDKDNVVAAIENEDYVRKLLEFFQICERDKDTENLQTLYRIFKNLFLMNRTAILQIMLSETNIIDVIGCLEYDPRVTTPSTHREFIRKQASFKDVIPITNTELLTKIHLMYKMQYIQDAILPAPSMFEENLMNALAQYILFQKIEIIEMIEKEETFLMDLFGGIEEENREGITPDKFKNLVFLLKEICLFSQAAQNPASKHNFSLILWNNGMMKSLGIILSSDDDVILQSGVDILLTMTEFAGTSIQLKITTEAETQEEDEQIINLLINTLVDPHKSSLDASTFHLLRTLIDPETFIPDMKPVDRTTFLSYFYKNCMHHLIAPLLAVTTDTRIHHLLDTVDNTEILANIIQLLAFCVEQHTYHSRVYIINKNLLSRVVVLLTSKHSHLVLMTIRLVRKILGMKEEGLNSYIIKNNLLQPLTSLLIATPKYNMINSACLELFSFILKEKTRGLLKYLIETLPEVKEIRYVELFTKMQIEYDHMKETEINPSRELEGLMSMQWSAKERDEQRREERDEEAWFDRDDDVYAINSSSPGEDATPMSTEPHPAITASPIKDSSPDSPTPPSSSVSVRTPTRLVEYEPDSDEDTDPEEVLDPFPVPTTSQPNIPTPDPLHPSSTPEDKIKPLSNPPDIELISPAKRPLKFVFPPARYLQSDDNYVQWTSQLRVLTFIKPKGEKVLGIRFRQVNIKAIDAALSKDSPSTVPIITEIIPDTPAAHCPCLWINDHLLCIKGYIYTDTQYEARQLEGVIAKCTYVQIVVQRAVRIYGPEKIAFIAGKRQKFGITFMEKKNLYQGKLSTMISGFSSRAETEYLEKGLELKSIILSINDRTLSDLPLSEAIPILMQESFLQDNIKIRFTTLQKFCDSIKKDPDINLALVNQPGPIPKLVLKESPSLPIIGAGRIDDPLRSVFSHDAQHYNYLKVYILGVKLFEDVYELVGRLLHESTRPRVSPLEDTCFERPNFSPDLYPNCSLVDQLFRAASADERVITELDLDSEWRPVCYTPVLSNLSYPADLSVRSPVHKMSPLHHKLDVIGPSTPLGDTGYGLKRPSSISLITPSSSSSSISSEQSPDLMVRCDMSSPIPTAAITLVLLRNTRELSSLSPPDIFPLFKRSGLYVMVINLERIFSFFESEIHFYLKVLTELHSLPFQEPVKVFIVGLYDSLLETTVRALCWSLHGLFESLFNSHVILDSKKFETCVFPIRRSDRNMDTVHVLRQTLLAFSRGTYPDHGVCEEDSTGLLRIPDNFNRFRVCSLLQSTVPVLLSEYIGQILVETELPEHHLEIALSALVECTPFLAPDNLSDLNEEGILLRPGIFLRILKQLEKWSGGDGLDRYPEQREICKQLRSSCYFNPTVLIHAIMQSCYKLSQIARALLRWMEKLDYIHIIGGPISTAEFEKYSMNKSMTPKPGPKNIKVFMPSIALWNDYKKLDTSTVFCDAHVFYLDVSDPISSRFYFLFLSELLRAVHQSNMTSLSPTRREIGILPLYDFQLFKGASIARLFDQELLGCNLEIINHHDQFQIEFRAKFGSTPSQALPNLLRQIYSCGGKALNKMNLTDKGFNIAIGPACPVEGCPGKKKTSGLSKATVSFVQVIQSNHPTRYQGISPCEMRGPLPCWGRPGVHVIDLSVNFRHPTKIVSHYSQCQDQIITPDSPIVCCQQHSSLRDWAPHDPPI
ncbi:Serine/threonine-protein phosphatase 4 regulatory subunit 3A-like isoform X2 [Oopsacas minuta]|uniref:Serine/threonine-protein phosphatase 4 regulatory subunit 3A-like isoform X2 n=1 Tax=Oopsacas minuta TaxID=111878 RepID=A0AAV7K0X7_9METZ|nr:Serine/threonine-protein phosphatase 4 regulatory subunit 3A-like isoform X2 [Oopsacas minuta]